MTVESTLTKRIYQADGIAREWPVPFAYSRTADIRLMHTDADGLETEITGNFLVNVNASGDTSVTCPLSGRPLPSGVRLTVYRGTPLTQIVDLEYGGAFMPDVLEKDGLDRLEMQIQETREAAERSVKLPISSAESPADYAASLLAARDAAGAAADRAASARDAAKACRDEAGAAADRAGAAADGARTERDRAEAAADRAANMTGVGPAGKNRFGFVRVGSGISVTEDGTISVRVTTVVTTPALSFPEVVGIGFEYEAVMSSETAVHGAHIAEFEIARGTSPAFRVPAVNGAARVMLTPEGEPGASRLVVTAVDSVGNVSFDSSRAFTQYAVNIRAPEVLSPPRGGLNVALAPAITVQPAAVTGPPGTPEGTHIQIAADAAFENLVFEHTPEEGYVTVCVCPPLSPQTLYFVRAKHCFEKYGCSAWGEPSSFETLFAGVRAPDVYAPADGALDQPLKPAIHISAFAGIGQEDVPKGTRIQISARSDFSAITAEHAGAYVTEFTPAENLERNKKHFVRARHEGDFLGFSPWSRTVEFTTINAWLAPPVIISPADGEEDAALSPVVALGGSAVVGQTLSKMQIQVSSGADFQTPVWDSGELDYARSRQIGVTLAKNTAYFLRVRLFGPVTGWTDWTTAGFTTQAAAVGEVWTFSGSATFTVPASGQYKLEAAGGGGSGASVSAYNSDVLCNGKYTTYATGYGGSGGHALTTKALTKGEALPVTVGGSGGSSSLGAHVSAPGGGAGSAWVERVWINTTNWSGDPVQITCDTARAANGTSYGGGGAGGSGAGGAGWCRITYLG